MAKMEIPDDVMDGLLRSTKELLYQAHELGLLSITPKDVRKYPAHFLQVAVMLAGWWMAAKQGTPRPDTKEFGDETFVFLADRIAETINKGDYPFRLARMGTPEADKLIKKAIDGTMKAEFMNAKQAKASYIPLDPTKTTFSGPTTGPGITEEPG